MSSPETLSYQATIPPVLEEAPRPLWSVMIPAYNCASYLRETLSSVLAQDPGPGVMQIEVVDDCSTEDDPAAVVQELGCGRVAFLRQPENVGFIRNFETCLQRSRGQLIHLLHGDDRVRDGFYRKLGRAFEENTDIGAAFCRHIYMDHDGHWQTISRMERRESGVIENWLEKIASGQRLVTPSIVVRRDVYEKLGGFDRRISCCGEDWEMWVRIALHYPVWFEVEPLAAYRMKRAGSLTGSFTRSGAATQDMLKATKIVEGHLSAHLSQAAATKLSGNVRARYARWALDDARQMLARSDLAAVPAQLRGALDFSSARQVRWTVLRLGVATIARWLWNAVRRPFHIRAEAARA